MKKTVLICLMALLSVAMLAQDNMVRLYAHRGGRAEFDENTQSAFDGAYKAGFRGFETDIRMTSDGELVLLHDSSLDRATNGKGNVETSKAKQLKNLKVGKSKVLFLEDLLKWIEKKGDIEYFEFEIKSDAALYSDEMVKEMCEAVYHRVMAVKPIGATFVISSTDPRPLEYLAKNFPTAELMLITGEPINNTTIDKAKDLGVKRLAGRIDGTSASAVEKAHKEGLIVNVWPTSDIKGIVLGLGLGADNICTDIPAAAKKALNKTLPWYTIEY